MRRLTFFLLISSSAWGQTAQTPSYEIGLQDRDDAHTGEKAVGI